MDSSTLLDAAEAVDRLATHLKSSGDTYEQGIGCELAGKMLRRMSEYNHGTGDVPEEIKLAAIKISNWFKDRNIKVWALYNVRSR